MNKHNKIIFCDGESIFTVVNEIIVDYYMSKFDVEIQDNKPWLVRNNETK